MTPYNYRVYADPGVSKHPFDGPARATATTRSIALIRA